MIKVIVGIILGLLIGMVTTSLYLPDSPQKVPPPQKKSVAAQPGM